MPNASRRDAKGVEKGRMWKWGAPYPQGMESWILNFISECYILVHFYTLFNKI